VDMLKRDGDSVRDMHSFDISGTAHLFWIAVDSLKLALQNWNLYRRHGIHVIHPTDMAAVAG